MNPLLRSPPPSPDCCELPYHVRKNAIFGGAPSRARVTTLASPNQLQHLHFDEDGFLTKRFLESFRSFSERYQDRQGCCSVPISLCRGTSVAECTSFRSKAQFLPTSNPVRSSRVSTECLCPTGSFLAVDFFSSPCFTH